MIDLFTLAAERAGVSRDKVKTVAWPVIYQQGATLQDAVPYLERFFGIDLSDYVVPPDDVLGWTPIRCVNCDGHGLVSGYTIGGGDFEGAEECSECNGTGRLWASPTGRLAAYPGSQFVGRLTHVSEIERLIKR